MSTSVLDLFNIGIGPSSSHTVGPMRAARDFIENVEKAGNLPKTVRVVTKLYGSLGATGRGHGSDTAVLLGLLGACPRGVDVEAIPDMIADIRARKNISLLGKQEVQFEEETDLQLLPRERLDFHPNGMEFWAYAECGTELSRAIYYSIGGGFIVTEHEAEMDHFDEEAVKHPYPFTSAQELLERCKETGRAISWVMLENEKVTHSEAHIRTSLLEIWDVMKECVQRGCSRGGVMPGLKVKRRAAELYKQLSTKAEAALTDPLTILDWVNLYALAVNEENAVGGRVVTAPTNGAAGIVPAVLHYYANFVPGANDDGIVRFLLTAGAVGRLFKENASISGAEVGCQGEVGSACSMAAAGLAEVLGGTPEQVENAAEIAMEHNLGLTCDPIGGLVQVPCIERNAMASIKAINAARLALKGDGEHFVTLDKVIRTMRITGRDMQSKYKETAEGGLAVTVPIAATVVDC